MPRFGRDQSRARRATGPEPQHRPRAAPRTSSGWGPASVRGSWPGGNARARARGRVLAGPALSGGAKGVAFDAFGDLKRPIFGAFAVCGSGAGRAVGVRSAGRTHHGALMAPHSSLLSATPPPKVRGRKWCMCIHSYIRGKPRETRREARDETRDETKDERTRDERRENERRDSREIRDERTRLERLRAHEPHVVSVFVRELYVSRVVV